MCNAGGDIIVAFNGEIYNAPQFRRDLEARGVTFHGTSDTEVLLDLYESHGLDGLLARINGMFAIFLCDLRRREIYLIRDRLGIKPLYYYRKDGTVLFGSEVKAFLACSEFDPRLAQDHLDEYLIWRYVSDDRHLLEDVHCVRPGEVIRFGQDHFEKREYWHIPVPSAAPPQSASEIADQTEQLVHDCVKRQLVSDVPVGCQLSGGVDSSLVTLMASKELSGSFHGVSILFDDPRFSEEPFIDQVSSTTPIDTHKCLMTSEYFADNLFDVTWFLDQPLGRPTYLANYLIAEEARRWMTVILSGEGADELFGGYYSHSYAGCRLPAIPWPISRLMKRLPQRIRSAVNQRFQTDCSGSKADWFMLLTATVGPKVLGGLRPGSDFQAALDVRRDIFADPGEDFVLSCMNYDMKTILVDLLVGQDKMTMAHSIENRVPYLDNEMIDFARGLSSRSLARYSFANTSKATKMPLKRVTDKHFGKAFAYRKKARLALENHLRGYTLGSRFTELAEDLLLPRLRDRAVLEPNVIEAWWRERSSIGQEEFAALWNALALEIWAQLFIDRGGRPAVSA